jgi:hypothetical protein
MTGPMRARAVAGSQPGKLTLNPPSGAVTLRPAWATSTACPAGFQTSADLYALTTNGKIGSVASPTVLSPTAPFSGTLLTTVGTSLSLGTDVKPGQSDQWVVACWSGPAGTGSVRYVQSARVTLSADGRTYTTSSSGARASGGTDGPGTAQPVPWALIMVLVAVAAAAIGGWQAWRRRRVRTALAAGRR